MATVVKERKRKSVAKNVITSREYSARTDYQHSYVLHLVRIGDLRGFKLGKSVLVDEEQAMNFYNNRPEEILQRIGRRKHLPVVSTQGKLSPGK